MAGLIDVGIIKPELANSFATGYRGAEQSRNLLAQQKQDTEMGQMRLEQLKQDRMSLLQLQDSLKSAGKDPDPVKVFDALIATGNPDYVMKGMDGKRRLTELQRADSVLRQFAPELFSAEPASAAPAGTPAFNLPAGAQPETMGRVPGVVTTPVPESPPMNAMAPAAPVNAMAPTAAPAAGADVNALRRQLTLLSSIDDPRAKALADVVKGQIQEAAKSYVVGGRLVTGAGRELYAAPDKPAAPPTSVAEFERAQTDPAFARFLSQRDANRRPVTTITNVAEKAEAGEFGKFLVNEFGDISKSANLAVKTMPAIETNLAILNKGFDTGFGAETKAAGAKVLSALGVANAEKFAANAEIFQAKAAETVLQKQLEQKGPQTQSDRELIEKTGAQLGTTTQGNRFLLTVAKEQLQRDIDQRDFYRNWREKTGSFNGAESAWFAGEGGKSLFERPALKKYTAPTRANASPAAVDNRTAALDAIFKPKK
jgi:hypothetical protein